MLAPPLESLSAKSPVARQAWRSGAAVEERVQRTEEGVDIIRKAWTEERFSFQGKHFQLHDVSITP